MTGHIVHICKLICLGDEFCHCVYGNVSWCSDTPSPGAQMHQCSLDWTWSSRSHIECWWKQHSNVPFHRKDQRKTQRMKVNFLFSWKPLGSSNIKPVHSLQPLSRAGRTKWRGFKWPEWPLQTPANCQLVVKHNVVPVLGRRARYKQPFSHS